MTTVIPASARMLAVSTPAMRAGQHYLDLPIVVLFIMISSGCPNLPVLRTSIVAVRPSDASNRLLGSRQSCYAAVANDSKITRPLNPQDVGVSISPGQNWVQRLCRRGVDVQVVWLRAWRVVPNWSPDRFQVVICRQSSGVNDDLVYLSGRGPQPDSSPVVRARRVLISASW